MTRKELLSDLRETCLALRPSAVQGIGVFAIRPILKGTRNMFAKENKDWIKISREEIEALPGPVKSLVKNYYVFDKDFYYVESSGLKKMDLVNFVNHSDKPNLIPINDGEFFEAIFDIKTDEELLINYYSLFKSNK